MFVSRRSVWGHTRKALALALAFTLAGCSDDEGDGEPVTLSGKVTYDFVPSTYSATTRSGTLAFNQTVVKPVRGAQVQVRQGTKVLTTATTDAEGKYTLTFTPSGDDDLMFYALAKTATPDIQVEDNTDGDAIWAVGTEIDADTTSKDLHAAHGWTGSSFNNTRRTAAPFAILDSMYTAAQAFMAVRTVNFPALKVNWSPDNVPQGGNKALGQIGTSHFSFNENEIYILGRDGADTDEFDNHVIVHEWGHYFEGNLSRSDSPGGPHSSGDVLDPRLSFGEGYGNALAAIILPEPMYADTFWSGSRGLTAFGFDAETAPVPTDDPLPGVFSESSVMRILYDLFDSGTNEPTYDTVSYNLGTIHDVLVGPQKSTEALTTLGAFLTGLKAQNGVSAAAVDTLVAHYSVGSVTSAFGDGDASLRAMYVNVPATYPYTTTFNLRGGDDYNKQEQNRYFVFTGTGRPMRIAASNASEDVGIEAYRLGEVVGSADTGLLGEESFTFNSQLDARYVLVVTGFSETEANYPVSLSITSP
ncbi:carboxypeptidase-like regulatory domain-containing protein [Pyxidicoccus xibeiensis]|uniref:carboxypeptidase-like regulatory domain-containing protein n=1 Tax=Pyxidicoccus xibeiensis TaxID=2906759 RepID=UPI0020A79A08|nr:carboxypeptidase-like regulatory domain-containing protein [Pyxidicoccus xibeiensis]MCP3143447.1 carboxypeptidase-like regulatory domain-containing protein [Pyxidicoccus xibeiensis]